MLGSRDTVFASELAELGGVDIVLNSLPSSGMVAGSLATLRPGGRFVEISKRDIWSPARIAQGALRVWRAQCRCHEPPHSSFPAGSPLHLVGADRPDVAYSLVAVDFLSDPAVNASLLRLSSDLGSGVVHPLPNIVHGMGTVQSALRQMSLARHAGKIVVRTPTMQQSHGGLQARAASKAPAAQHWSEWLNCAARQHPKHASRVTTHPCMPCREPSLWLAASA